MNLICFLILKNLKKGYGIHETEISTLTNEHYVIRNDCPFSYVHNVP